MKTRRTNRQRSGFTLMELLLVMAILVVLSSLVTFSFVRMQKNSFKNITRTNISTLKRACVIYNTDVGRFPSELQDLMTAPSGLPAGKWQGPYLPTDVPNQLADAWGNPYQYNSQAGSDTVSIISPGEDGAPNTADDIPSPQEQQASGTN